MDIENQAVKNDTESAPVTTPENQPSDSQKDDSADRPIPYARFKEKVLEVKDLKKAIEKLASEKEQYGQQIAQQYQTYYESELAKSKRMADEQSYNAYEAPVEDKRVGEISNELSSLKSHIQRLQEEAEQNKIKSQVNGLSSVFPEMDEEHVFAIKRLKPDWSLEECAEYSHKHFNDKISSRVKEMIEKKKEAARKPIFGDGGKFNLKPEERPKDLKEANKKLIQYMASFEG